MSKYVSALISALVVIALAVGYALFFFLVLEEAEMKRVVMVIVAVVSGFVVAGVGTALVMRIRELRGGQEDDIGKY
jgi:hypothetical protein